MLLLLQKRCFSLQLCVFVLLLVSCQNKEKEDKNPAPTEEEKKAAPAEVQGLPLQVIADKVYLRSEAGIEGDVVAALPAQSLVYDLGEVSSFLTQIQRQGKNYEAPWLKVQTPEGQSGWVFGSPFMLKTVNVRGDFFLEKRMVAVFGEKVLEAYQTYERQKDSIRQADGFLRAYQSLKQLRSRLLEQLNQEMEKKQDLFWLSDLLPELIPQLNPDDQSPELYLDYRFWLEQARQTNDPADDAFVDICLTAFPDDSIEYRFPAWFLQTSANNGHSLLGRGIHLEMFEKIENLYNISETFKGELALFEEALIEDIILLNTTYWEEKEKVENELKTILNNNYAFLDESNRLALQNRLKAFGQAKELGILFNVKSGVHELE